MAAVVGAGPRRRLAAIFEAAGEQVLEIGRIVPYQGSGPRVLIRAPHAPGRPRDADSRAPKLQPDAAKPGAVKKLKVAVLVSGRGSNLQALIDACADPEFPAEITLVVSNVAGAHGLARARPPASPAASSTTGCLPSRAPSTPRCTPRSCESGAELVCLAGFMRLLTDGFVEPWRDRLINIHPSLLPAFRGLRVHERVIAARRPLLRLHRALRPAGDGRRPDHRAGGGAGACGRRRRTAGRPGAGGRAPDLSAGAVG